MAAELKWVTHKGKHIPLNASESGKESGKTAGKSVGTINGTAGGSGGKKQLSKKDELKSLKGPKTVKKGK